MPRLATLLLLAALAVPLAQAQRAKPVTGLELGADPSRAVSQDGREFLTTGYYAVLSGLDASVGAGTAEQKARRFLADRAPDLGGYDAELDLVSAHKRRSGTIVRFQQTVGGVPIWGAATTVSLDPSGRIQFVANGLYDFAALDTAPRVPAEAATATAMAHLGASARATPQTRLIVWPSTPMRLAWSVRADGEGVPTGDWHSVVDAQTGELIRVADRAAYHDDDDAPAGPTALPLAEMAPGFSIRGYGYVYDPDPPTAGRVLYGGDIADNNDGANEAINALRKRVVLRDLTFDGENYELKNQWADVTEWDAPNKGIFLQDSLNYLFDRSADSFEVVSAFYHIDQYMRYVNETLQVDVRPTAYPGGVQFDAHGVNGQDNSYYTGASQRIAFGEGCVDDAEGADVVIHELGHGLHDWITDGGLSNFDGLSEGIGDYLAVSYARSLNLMEPSEPKYNWVFRWVGHQPCWPQGRITNYTATYPTGQAPHTRGQHWSTSLMRVWDQIGREATDLAMFEGVSRTNSSTSQPQAALAVVQAARDLGYPDADVQAFIDSFNEQGYDLPPLTAQRPLEAAAAGVFVSSPAPNPFNGLTTLDVMVDRPQAVTVEVFDAVGRQVATLFAGEMTAGQRFPMSLDAAGLVSGVYVVRVTGESVATARRVTVVR